MMAGIHRKSGRYSQAVDVYEVALRLSRQTGDPYEEGKVLEGMAEAVLNTHRFEAARIALRQALDIYERLEVPEVEAVRTRLETMTPPYVARIS